MSRIDHDLIWLNFFRCDLNHANCPICKKVIFRGERKNRQSGWNRGHIISCQIGGRDILTNLIPICIECNLKMGSKSLFEYLYQLEKISIEERDFWFKYQKMISDKYDPICKGKTQLGRRCTHRKIYLTNDERPEYWQYLYDDSMTRRFFQQNTGCAKHFNTECRNMITESSLTRGF